MKKSILLVLLVFPMLQAMETEVKTVPLSKEDLWLVHQARIFPENGCVIAGGVARVAGNGTLFTPHTLEQSYLFAKNTITGWRYSTHWSLNSLVYPHELFNTGLSETQTNDRTDSFYVILEPLGAFEGEKLFGYWQDVFTIGGHTLSADAIILVPEGDSSYEPYMGDYKGNIQTYRSDLRAAVEEVLEYHKTPILYPCMKGLPQKKEQYYHHDGANQAVVLDGKKYSCKELSDHVVLDNVVHSTSSHGEAQGLFLEVIKSFRAAQGMDFYLKQILSGGDACVVCRKKFEQNKKHCSTCKKVYYCSVECQRKHWREHKKICKNLSFVKNFFNENQLKYIQYLRAFALDNDWGDNRFEVLLSNILGKIEDVITGCSSKRELLLMKSYKEYATGMLCDLLSPKEEYAALRARYKIETVEGFLVFSKMIQQKYALIAAKFDGTESL